MKIIFQASKQPYQYTSSHTPLSVNFQERTDNIFIILFSSRSIVLKTVPLKISYFMLFTRGNSEKDRSDLTKRLRVRHVLMMIRTGGKNPSHQPVYEVC